MHKLLIGRAVALIAALLLLSSAILTSTKAAAENVSIRPDAPTRYTVQKGDTLWGIADRFLSDPWRWPAIWKVNEQIKNPHLIYPGDVIVMGFDENGNPILKLLRNQRFGDNTTSKTMKLSPGIYVDERKEAIPSIPPNIIEPFLTRSIVVSENELEHSAYVTGGVEDNIIVGKHQQFYARGFAESVEDVYQVFRVARPLKDPDTGEVLGYDTLHVADARKLNYNGDVAKFESTSANREISPRDRMLPTPDVGALPYYFPKAPDRDITGKIIHLHDAIKEIGHLGVVAINLGEDAGISTGTVLRIKRQGLTRKDPVTGKLFDLPTENTGLVMVFRTFERVSYAIVLKSTRQVLLHDIVATP